MQISSSEYNVLVVAAAYYALHESKRALSLILTCLKNNKPSDEALWEIFAECRIRDAHPAVRKFYEELRTLYPGEWKQAE